MNELSQPLTLWNFLWAALSPVIVVSMAVTLLRLHNYHEPSFANIWLQVPYYWRLINALVQLLFALGAKDDFLFSAWRWKSKGRFICCIIFAVFRRNRKWLVKLIVPVFVTSVCFTAQLLPLFLCSDLLGPAVLLLRQSYSLLARGQFWIILIGNFVLVNFHLHTYFPVIYSDFLMISGCELTLASLFFKWFVYIYICICSGHLFCIVRIWLSVFVLASFVQYSGHTLPEFMWWEFHAHENEQQLRVRFKECSAQLEGEHMITSSTSSHPECCCQQRLVPACLSLKVEVRRMRRMRLLSGSENSILSANRTE